VAGSSSMYFLEWIPEGREGGREGGKMSNCEVREMCEVNRKGHLLLPIIPPCLPPSFTYISDSGPSKRGW